MFKQFTLEKKQQKKRTPTIVIVAHFLSMICLWLGKKTNQNESQLPVQWL